MKQLILVEITAIPGPEDTPELMQEACRKAVQEALRVHWKGNLQHRHEDKFLLADFKTHILTSNTGESIGIHRAPSDPG